MKKYVPLALLLLAFFIGCRKNKGTTSNTAQILRDSIVSQQKIIKLFSDNIAVQMLDPANTYTNSSVQTNIGAFNTARLAQKSTIASLVAVDPADTGSVVEMVVCGDFEDETCFIDNWDILKSSGLIIKLDSSVSYNHSHSLYLSSPFDSTMFNQRNMSLTSYIKGITDTSIYKIRFWAKYNGRTSRDNSPATSITIEQNGKFVTEYPVGVCNGSYLNEDWTWYSFQVVTTSASPLEISIVSHIQNCWIDDLHIVKK